MSRGLFYLSRLRNATLSELAYRTREMLFVRRTRSAVMRRRIPARLPQLDMADVRTLAAPTMRIMATAATVEEILGGRIFTLNEEPSRLLECEQGARGTYSPDIGRDRLGCDVRALWEPARLQHLTLLMAHFVSDGIEERGDEIREFIRDALGNWLDANPSFTGPHYMSAMECGLRVPVFFLALKCLGTTVGNDWQRLMEAIYHHAWWIERRLSLHSSLGNHTVCECVGLVFAGAVFRKTEEGKRWLGRGIELLRQELDHQVVADGGPVEQSFSYHRFVLDLYWFVIDFIEKNNLGECHDFKVRLWAGEEFLSCFTDGSGHIPPVGDSDDGFALAPGLAPKRMPVTKAPEPVRTFPASGYTVLGGKGGKLLAFDHGPLGMAPLYNHGHADALSVTFSVGGAHILVDPGTYRYNGADQFRRYFKGTRAHNTVAIDGEDQALQVTGFIWSRPFRSRLLRSVATPDGHLVEAEHDGYRRLPGGVTHRRSILFRDSGDFLIRDTFAGEGEHRYELNFHLNPDAEVTLNGATARVRVGGITLVLTTVGGGEFDCVHGGEEPLLGWHSPAYGVLRPTWVLRRVEEGRPRNVSFVTAVSIGEETRQMNGEEMLCSMARYE